MVEMVETLLYDYDLFLTKNIVTLRGMKKRKQLSQSVNIFKLSDKPMILGFFFFNL